MGQFRNITNLLGHPRGPSKAELGEGYGPDLQRLFSYSTSSGNLFLGLYNFLGADGWDRFRHTTHRIRTPVPMTDTRRAPSQPWTEPSS